MVRITAFMARLKAYLWALRAPSADAEGQGPACLSRTLRAHPHGGTLALGRPSCLMENEPTHVP